MLLQLRLVQIENILHRAKKVVIPQGTVGMARDVNLKVAGKQTAMAPVYKIDRSTSERNKQRKPPVAGS